MAERAHRARVAVQFPDAPKGTCKHCGRSCAANRRTHDECRERQAAANDYRGAARRREGEKRRCVDCRLVDGQTRKVPGDFPGGWKWERVKIQQDHPQELIDNGRRDWTVPRCQRCHNEKTQREKDRRKGSTMSGDRGHGTWWRLPAGVALLVAAAWYHQRGADRLGRVEGPEDFGAVGGVLLDALVVGALAAALVLVLVLWWRTVSRRRAEAVERLGDLVAQRTHTDPTRIRMRVTRWRGGAPVRASCHYGPTFDDSADGGRRGEVEEVVQRKVGTPLTFTWRPHRDVLAWQPRGDADVAEPEPAAVTEPVERPLTHRERVEAVHARVEESVRATIKGDVDVTWGAADAVGPTVVRVRYPSTYNDDNPETRLTLADRVNHKAPGRWKATWDTEHNEVTFERRPPMPEKVQRPVPDDAAKADTWRLPLGVDESGKTVHWDLRTMPHMLVAGTTGGGKALALDTPIPTPTGATFMGDLVDGDVVFDEIGAPCKVVKAHAVMHGRDCYEVEFSDGEVLVADGEHLWATYTHRERHSKTPGGPRPGTYKRVHSTAEIAATLRVDGRTNHAVPLTSPLRLPEVDLPIDPYVLGVWLGDGWSYGAQVFTADAEIIAGIEAAGHACKPLASDPYGYGVADLRSSLRKANLLQNKHVPLAYLRASEAQRRALLAGLLDTDGACDLDGKVTFAVTNPRLAGAVFDLAAGLGMRPTATRRRVRGRSEETSTYYQVQWTSDQQVFRLRRKAERIRATRETQRWRYIVDVRSVESVPVRCITVDSPNRLYLAGRAYIPTHNTVTISGLIVEALGRGFEVVIVDGKGTALAGFRDWPGVSAAGLGEPEDMAEAMEFAETAMRRRYARIRDWGDEPEDFTPMLVVLDEAAEFATAVKKWHGLLPRVTRDNDGEALPKPKDAPSLDAWRSIARLGREGHVHLVVGIQQAAASFFGGTESREQLPARVGCGPLKAEGARMLFGRGDVGRDLPPTAKGRATVEVDDAGPREMQTYWTPTPKANGEVREDDAPLLDGFRAVAEARHHRPTRRSQAEQSLPEWDPVRLDDLAEGDQVLVDVDGIDREATLAAKPCESFDDDSVYEVDYRLPDGTVGMLLADVDDRIRRCARVDARH